MRLLPISVLFSVLLAAVPAVASGGLDCAAQDANVDFQVSTAVTRGMGGPFFNFKASLALSLAGVPDDLKALTLDDRLVHSWLDRDEVKLEFYVERQEGEFASVSFVIETTAVDEGEYRGTYRLDVFAPQSPAATETGEIEATGAIVCYAE